MEKPSYVKFDPAWGFEPLPPVKAKNLHGLLDETASRMPDKTALISFDKKISFSELCSLSDDVADFLIKEGVKKGDRVATMMPNCAQHVISFLGIVKAGAISVPCNVMFQKEELTYLLKDSGATVIICLDVFYPLIMAVKTNTALEHVILVHLKDMSSTGAWIPPVFNPPKKGFPEACDFMDIVGREDYGGPAKVTVGPDDVALIIYTSGTTGPPKGVMETHANLIYQCLTHSHLVGINGSDTNAQILPMFHTSGYMLFLLPTLYFGGTVVIIPLFEREQFLRCIFDYKVNVLLGTPTLYIALLSHPRLFEYDFSNFKIMIASGAPVPAELQKKWNEATGRQLVVGWGMTETNSGATLNLSNKNKLCSIGVPMACEIKVVDERGIVVPRGQVGELMVRGPMVAKGYWNKPEETGQTFLADGWLRTGDAGYIDEEDFAHYTDRIKDLIIASGYNIAPFEVESILMKHPAVREAAVIGVPDQYRGENVKAFVVLSDEYRGRVSEESILEFCRENMATFKRPRTVQFLEELPKNTVGKVLKTRLRAE